MNGRIAYLDIAKALAIFLVVWGHVIVFNSTASYENPVAQGIYSFHTAFFMFLSGYFFSYALKKDVKTLIVEKSRQLLLPYLCWSIISLMFIKIPEVGLDNIGDVLHDFILGGVFRYYWYLKALFLYTVVTYLLIKITNNEYIGCGLSWLLFTILPNFSFSVIFIPFFVLGHFAKPFIEKCDKWNVIGGLVIVDIMLYLFWDQSYIYTSLNMSPLPYTIRTGVGVVTSLIIILTLKKICYTAGGYITSLLSYIGSITLGVYVSHEMFYSKVLWGWLTGQFPSDNHAVFLSWAIIATLLSVFLISLLTKNKWTAFLLLGRRLN